MRIYLQTDCMERKHLEQFLVLEDKNNVAGTSKSPQYM